MSRRLLHTMYRVGDLPRSIEFYTKVLGMTHLRTVDVKEEEYTLAFLGYGPETEATVLELTYNYGKKTYDHGGAYGHICIGVPDLNAEVARLKQLHVPIDYHSSDGFMAFIQDPDGYQIELLNDSMMMVAAKRDYESMKAKK